MEKRYIGTTEDRLSNEALKSSGRLKQEVNNEQVQFCSSFNILSKSEVRKFISKKRQKEYDRMLQIHKNILSFDDNREMGLSEEDYENCFTESSFLY